MSQISTEAPHRSIIAAHFLFTVASALYLRFLAIMHPDITNIAVTTAETINISIESSVSLVQIYPEKKVWTLKFPIKLSGSTPDFSFFYNFFFFLLNSLISP